jgi:hypothetical protein
MLAAVPVEAQSQLAEIREGFIELLIQLRTIDNTCVITLGGLLGEVQTSILHARKLIGTGKGNLTNLLLDTLGDAVTHSEIATSQFVECIALFEMFVISITDLSNELLALTERFNLTKIEIILSLLLDVTTRSIALTNSLAETSFLFGAASAIITAVYAQILSITTASKGPFTLAQLREFKAALGSVFRVIKLVQQGGMKNFIRNKKWLLKDIREIKELLRSLDFSARPLKGLDARAAHIYTLEGKFVGMQSGASLNLNRLANGVYLVVTQSNIEKWVVAR